MIERFGEVEIRPKEALESFIKITQEYVGAKKAWLLDEFGSDDYAIKGVVVVGSVASGTERPDSDIDLYVLISGRGDLDDFMDNVQHLSDRNIDLISTIDISKGEVFEQSNEQTAQEAFADRGYYSTDYHYIAF